MDNKNVNRIALFFSDIQPPTQDIFSKDIVPQLQQHHVKKNEFMFSETH